MSHRIIVTNKTGSHSTLTDENNIDKVEACARDLFQGAVKGSELFIFEDRGVKQDLWYYELALGEEV